MGGTRVDFRAFIDLLVMGFELAGVLALVAGAIWSGVNFARDYFRVVNARTQAYRQLRQGLGRAILVGLELLVAADIIRTIAIDPTFQSVGVLGLIVVVRTFLSWSLEVEVNGRWPWQGAPVVSAGAAEGGEL
jgi:uncharacterized membrane protein